MRRPALAIVVGGAGLLGSIAPSVLLLNGLYGLPVVLVWALVYGYARNAEGRWPWWVMGQWASLSGVFAVAGLAFGAEGGMHPAFGPLAATVMTVVWMILVGLATVHSRFWFTRRPAEEPLAHGSSNADGSTTL